MLFNGMNSTCSKRNTISQLLGSPRTKGGLSDISIQKSRKIRFKEGDLILRMVLPNTKEVNTGVFGPNWESSYIIVEVIQPGTYKLKWLDGKLVPRSWNVEHLRPYYQ